MELIEEGSDVLLYLDARRTYLIKVKKGKEFHTHKGFIQLGDLIGRPYGCVIESNLGVRFYALRPLIRDRVLKTERRTQVIYPKDMGFILLMADVGPGSRVVEAGTGSGALTLALANAVRPDGRIYSYEIRPEFQRAAMRNIERAGLKAYVEFKLRDITEGIEEEEVDAVILDMATPWLVVPHAHEALKGGGVFLSFSPTIEQVMRTVSVLRKHPFVEMETYEILLRRFVVEEHRTRPETLMIGHTGYITVGRKVLE